MRFKLTGGQCNDITQASDLLSGFENANVLAGKGYDSDKLVSQIQKQNCTPVIPPRAKRKNPRTYDKHVYKERHLVECFLIKSNISEDPSHALIKNPAHSWAFIAEIL